MRFWAAMLVVFWTLPVRAECVAQPERSASRSVSDQPIDIPLADHCPPSPSGEGLEPNEGWAAGRDPRKVGLTRLGALAVAFGGMLLLTGAGFALCSGDDSPSRDTCRAAEAPILISGAAFAAFGMGALAVGTWVVPEHSSAGRAAIAAGADLRLAFGG